MQKWEYKQLSPIVFDTMNGLGEEGWELVAIDTSGNRPVAYFKRPKQ